MHKKKYLFFFSFLYLPSGFLASYDKQKVGQNRNKDRKTKKMQAIDDNNKKTKKQETQME